MSTNIKFNGTIQEQVKQLLIDKPSNRDDDNKLVANIWNKELNALKMSAKIISAFELLQLLADGKLTNSDSITRARRKIQEEYPELRGEHYRARQNKQEQIKKDLNYGN